MKSVSLSAIRQSKVQWIFKYKLHHLPFWFGYHFMWWTLRIGSPAAVLASLTLPHAAAKFFFYMIFQMAGVYFNLYFLIPAFLEKGKYAAYVILLLLTIIASACLVTTGYYVAAFVAAKSVTELFGSQVTFFTLFEGGALPSTAAAMTLAMSINLTRNWMQTQKRERMLEREKLETELKFLKSQMNPHFLFNTINSIFVLIHKNPLMASESLAKFSDLLRYQLYECNEQQIPLSQELAYVENFIELQGLRQDHDDIDLQIHIDPYETCDLVIAPFVLIPFIENAFKHVSRKNEGSNWIKMEIQFKERQFHFSIANSTSATHHASAEVVKHGGIGLNNVRRRLHLVYPDCHRLTIIENAGCYEVKLQLTLQEASLRERKIVTA
jgi:two-component system LytT family sensor kinase